LGKVKSVICNHNNNKRKSALLTLRHTESAQGAYKHTCTFL